MASKNDVANLAAIKLGQIPNFDIETQNTKTAMILASLWNVVRDSVLQAYPWHFARVRTTLAPLSLAPEWGKKYAYALPSDFLNLVEVLRDFDGYYTSDTYLPFLNDTPVYQLEGGNLLTDIGPVLRIIYTARKEVVQEYPPLLVEALGTRLAAEACEIITQNDTKKQLLIAEYRAILKEAYRTDAVDQPSQRHGLGDYVLSRF